MCNASPASRYTHAYILRLTAACLTVNPMRKDEQHDHELEVVQAAAHYQIRRGVLHTAFSARTAGLGQM